MATSPTPSLDSIRGTNSIESYGEHTGYLSDSPLTLSGSSPPVSDSAICDEFTNTGSVGNQHHPISASVSSSSSSSSSSGLSGCGSTSSANSANSNQSCTNINKSNSNSNSNGISISISGGGGVGGVGCVGGIGNVGGVPPGGGGNGGGVGNNAGPGVIGSNLSNGKGSPLSNNFLNTTNNSGVVSAETSNINCGGGGMSSPPRCTACKSKQSDAVAKCFECISYLCANCVTAHQFMHCFNGHNVSLIKGFETATAAATTTTSNNNSNNNANSATTNQPMSTASTSAPSMPATATSSVSQSASASSNTSTNLTTAQQQQQQQHQQQQQQHQQQQQQHQQQQQQQQQTSASSNMVTADLKFSSSLTMMLQQQQQQQISKSFSQLSKLVLNSHVVATLGENNGGDHQHQLENVNCNSNGVTNDDLFGNMLVMPQLRSTTTTTPAVAATTTYCRRHKNEPLKYNCRTCCKIICNECMLLDHTAGLHELEHLQEHQLTAIAAANYHQIPQTTTTQQTQPQTNSSASSVSSSSSPSATTSSSMSVSSAVSAASAAAQAAFNNTQHQQQHQQQQQQQQQQNASSETVLQTILTELRGKIAEIVSLVSSNSDTNTSKIKMQYQKAHNEVNETYQFFCSMIDERKQEVIKELENIYNAKIASSNIWLQRSKELIDKAVNTCDSLERSPKTHSVTDVLMLRKMLEQQLQTALMDTHLPFELEFISNYQSIQAGVRNTFGYIRPGSAAGGGHHHHADTSFNGGGGIVATLNGPLIKQPPIARPIQTSSNSSSSNSSISGGVGGAHLPMGLGLSASLLENAYNSAIVGSGGGGGGGVGAGGILGRTHNHNLNGVNGGSSSTFEELMVKRYHHHSSHHGTSGVGNGVMAPYVSLNPYEKWSNGGSDNLFSSSSTTTNTDPFSSAQLLNSLTNSVVVGGSTNSTNGVGGVLGGSSIGGSTLSILSGGGMTGHNNTTSTNDSLMDLTSKLLNTSITTYPPKSQIKRQKMIYHCKFGEFGVLEGQFTEPSGVAVNAQNDIIVADTNNHRIQIFDKEGRFKFQFGECGKRDSQLLYPNRVAVVRNSGDIIVTERSPTHQIQIYNQYGQFVRKFGANILQHPRGVTVDNKGRIIVVECKVMRVIIFDQNGNVIHKFGCSKHLEFPNGVVVNDKQEIFISDNRAHCVKVFNYEGQYLRQIGGEGVTNYPIGVGINANGEILIADNHNNFNLTIFTQDGQLVSALESKVKHAQCFDVALMDDGSVVLASKDYRLYIYRYVQVPPIVL